MKPVEVDVISLVERRDINWTMHVVEAASLGGVPQQLHRVVPWWFARDPMVYAEEAIR